MKFTEFYREYLGMLISIAKVILPEIFSKRAVHEFIRDMKQLFQNIAVVLIVIFALITPVLAFFLLPALLGDSPGAMAAAAGAALLIMFLFSIPVVLYIGKNL